ncbi:hypothetical protein SAMN05428989_1617 [Pseudoxanthomonas sp. GM95]|uniref:acyl-CoA dehydrogenase n=1 Tax=Pseudoxanthomonas sp. GM95 TaxID=1881043 RepID=UPI0008B52E9E|nr:acyl-CoA dehydrogenase [Pseudoxanthomonas sp. GM95]SEL18093.1 hypothetical protein SAMN05428989_1617 [Pseudoxanthomonas sp. GM95]
MQVFLADTIDINDQALRIANWRNLRAAAINFIASTPTLPLPGRGNTLDRWRALSAIGGQDLALVKVLEAHFDAQAILADLDAAAMATGELWAVWAAEPPGVVLDFTATTETSGLLSGTKAWCSGAQIASHALLTATAGGRQVLCRAVVDLEYMDYDTSRWQAVGMSRISSGTLMLRGARASLVGPPGAYLDRPGFWHGGAGIAACWFGATTAIAGRLREDRRVKSNPHVAAHLGAIDIALSAVAALFRETAALIDAQPRQAHRHEIVRLRALMDRVASDVIERVGRALGAGPLCTEHDHAQRCADLMVFLRQAHAESDEQRLGEALFDGETRTWRL